MTVAVPDRIPSCFLEEEMLLMSVDLVRMHTLAKGEEDTASVVNVLTEKRFPGTMLKMCSSKSK